MLTNFLPIGYSDNKSASHQFVILFVCLFYFLMLIWAFIHFSLYFFFFKIAELLHNLSMYRMATAEVPSGVHIPLIGNLCYRTEVWSCHSGSTGYPKSEWAWLWFLDPKMINWIWATWIWFHVYLKSFSSWNIDVDFKPHEFRIFHCYKFSGIKISTFNKYSVVIKCSVAYKTQIFMASFCLYTSAHHNNAGCLW